MIPWYNERICLNVLAKDHQNAIDIYEAMEGHVLVGVLSTRYPSLEVAVPDLKQYQAEIKDAVSLGLGAGNPNQWRAVSEIAKEVLPMHINQVFSAVGHTRANTGNVSFINCLVSPSGQVGYVKINTGPLSSNAENAANIPVETAILMAKEMGANSLKYFPMKGTQVMDEYKAVAQACAKLDFALEPTGGIDLDNFEVIVQTALNAGVPKIIPHVYSSIMNDAGETKIEDVKTLKALIEKLKY